MAALCAVSDPEDFGDTFDAACTDDLAAMTARQEESTKERSGNASQDSQDTSRTSPPQRHLDDRPHAPRLSKTPGTFVPGAPPSGSRGRASHAVRKPHLRPNSPPRRRNQMPRSRLSSSSSGTTASASTTRGVNTAPAWLPKGVAPTHAQKPVS